MHDKKRGILQCCRKGILPNDFRQAKIRQFHSQVFVYEKDVLRLDVSMNNPPIMLLDISMGLSKREDREEAHQIFQTLKKLDKHLTSLVFCKFLIPDDVIKQFAFWGKLKH